MDGPRFPPPAAHCALRSGKRAEVRSWRSVKTPWLRWRPPETQGSRPPHVTPRRSQDAVTYTERLLKLTLQGLIVGPDYDADGKDIRKICKTVLSDLERTHGGRRKLRSAILSEQPES